MAAVQSHRAGVRGSRSQTQRGVRGAAPVLAFLIGALAVAVFALAYLAVKGPNPLTSPRVEMNLPRAPRLPQPAPMPNPEPIPLPTPRPG